jgi:hypothetical protein
VCHSEHTWGEVLRFPCVIVSEEPQDNDKQQQGKPHPAASNTELRKHVIISSGNC